MRKNIVITGAGGFIGTSLTRKLLKLGFPTHVLIRPGGSLWRLADIASQLSIHEGLLTDRKLLTKFMRKIKPLYVYHLATYGAYSFQQDIESTINVNIKGSINLLESLKGIPCKAIVVAGSSSEYGRKERAMKENDMLEPNNYYGVTKVAQTYICQMFAKEQRIPVVVLRLFSVYGPYEEKGRLVRSVIETALQKKPILLATGKEARDFIYVDDVVDAFIYASQKKVVAGEVFNIGAGKQTTTKELAEKVRSLIGVNVPIKLHAYPGRPWDTYHWKASTHKTRNKLGFRASTTLDAGLLKTIEWYKTHG